SIATDVPSNRWAGNSGWFRDAVGSGSTRPLAWTVHRSVPGAVEANSKHRALSRSSRRVTATGPGGSDRTSGSRKRSSRRTAAGARYRVRAAASAEVVIRAAGAQDGAGDPMVVQPAHGLGKSVETAGPRARVRGARLQRDPQSAGIRARAHARGGQGMAVALERIRRRRHAGRGGEVGEGRETGDERAGPGPL